MNDTITMEDIIKELALDLHIELEEDIDITDLSEIIENFYEFNDDNYYGWYNSVTNEIVVELNEDSYDYNGNNMSVEMEYVVNSRVAYFKS
jgi:hypothetical protein